MKKLTPTEMIKLFKVILKEASKVFQKPGYQVSLHQFLMIANGRLGMGSIGKIGSYATVREYVCPTPNKDRNLNEAVSCIERIIKNAKTA